MGISTLPQRPSMVGIQSTAEQTRLWTILQDAAAATATRYQTKDSALSVMDCVKVIAKPGGGYLGVYHTLAGGVFTSKVADSTDLMNWTWRANLGTHESQPSIFALPDGGFVVPVEADNNGIQSPSATWIRFKHYTSVANLLAGTAAATFDTEHTLVGPISGGGAEGTPHIYSALSYTSIGASVFDVGWHYFQGAMTDRQARGTLTNFSSWSTRTEPLLDAAIQAQGAAGKIGDRDSLVYQGRLLNVVEAQLVLDDDATWRTYLYDWSTGVARLVPVRTDGGSTGFANPTFSLLPGPAGGTVLFASMFLHSSAAAPGESGSLIYYRSL